MMMIFTFWSISHFQLDIMRLSLSVVASRLVPSAACSGRVLIARLFDFNHTLGDEDVMFI